MNANCVICADMFDSTSEIVAAPCGHVYHANCLTTWVNRSKSCPQCRLPTNLRGIKKLYFNFLSQSETNSTNLESEIVILTSQLNAKESELRTCKREIDNHIAYALDAEEKTSNLLTAVSELQHEVSQLRVKAQSLSFVNSEVLELKQINAALSNDLVHFRGIQEIVRGTQKDVEDILREHINHSNSAEQLATYCACLKRELLEAVSHKSNLMQLNSKMKHDSNVNSAKLKFYEDAMGIPKSEFIGKMPAFSKPASKLVTSENFISTTSCPSRDYVEEICLSPLSVKFNENGFNLCIGGTNGVRGHASSSQTNLQFESKASGVTRRKEDIKIKYSGLDGHGKMTASSGFRKIKIMKQT